MSFKGRLYHSLNPNPIFKDTIKFTKDEMFLSYEDGKSVIPAFTNTRRKYSIRFIDKSEIVSGFFAEVKYGLPDTNESTWKTGYLKTNLVNRFSAKWVHRKESRILQKIWWKIVIPIGVALFVAWILHGRYGNPYNDSANEPRNVLDTIPNITDTATIDTSFIGCGGSDTIHSP